MNATRAFEQHTDLIRALTRPNSAARHWFDDYHEQIGINPLTGEKQPVIALADQAHLISQVRAGQMMSNVSLVAGFVPSPPDEDSVVQVGVLDPEQVRAEFAGTAEPGEEVPDIVGVPRPVLTQIAVDALGKAPTIYVTADMVTVLEYAASALDDTDVMPFHPAHPYGFVVLARPLLLPYGDGGQQVVHAFGWVTLSNVRTAFGGTGRVGMVWQFVDRHDHDGDRAVGFAQQRHPSRRSWVDSPSLVLNITDQFVTGTSVGRAVESQDEGEAERLRRALLHALEHSDGQAEPQPSESPDPNAPVVGRFQPYLAALLLLLGQEITATRREAVGGHARKRAQRSGRIGDTVTVVDLAPRSHSDAEGVGERGDRHYSHRHLVTGYWRWQPYGPGRRLRRRIYVSGYVRGPDDTPLVVKPRVHRL